MSGDGDIGKITERLGQVLGEIKGGEIEVHPVTATGQRVGGEREVDLRLLQVLHHPHSYGLQAVS